MLQNLRAISSPDAENAMGSQTLQLVLTTTPEAASKTLPGIYQPSATASDAGITTIHTLRTAFASKSAPTAFPQESRYSTISASSLAKDYTPYTPRILSSGPAAHGSGEARGAKKSPAMTEAVSSSNTTTTETHSPAQQALTTSTSTLTNLKSRKIQHADDTRVKDKEPTCHTSSERSIPTLLFPRASPTPSDSSIPPSPTMTDITDSTPINRKKRRMSSNHEDSPATKRRVRPPYSTEQDDFIRFVRDDLCHSWVIAQKLYNQFWHPGGDGKREIPGLQSRYYRLLNTSVRERKKDSVGRPELGILAKTDRRYWWMTGAYDPEERREMEREKARRKQKRAHEEEDDEDDGEETEEDVAMSSDEESHAAALTAALQRERANAREAERRGSKARIRTEATDDEV